MKKRIISLILFVFVCGLLHGGEGKEAGSGSDNPKGTTKKPHMVEIDKVPEHPVDASHAEIGPIGESTEKGCVSFEDISNFCMGQNGEILTCDRAAKAIKIIDGTGKLIKTWALPMKPYAIDYDSKLGVYVAGEGIVIRLGKTGKVIKSITSEDGGFPDGNASGVAIMGDEVFVAFGTGWSTRSLSSLVRFDKELSKAKVIAEKLRGCCQRLDMIASGKNLYVAENARHRVLVMDREGKVVNKWGSRDRINISGFGSCCNPMNLYLSKEGEIYTAESGLGRIKRYSRDGEFLGLVGYVGTTRFTRASRVAASCSNISIGVSEDGSLVYVLDYDKNLIRVLKTKDDKTKGNK